MPTTTEQPRSMWDHYTVTIQFVGPLAAAIPKHPKAILAMLEHRQPARVPKNATPLPELAEQVAEEVGADEEAPVGYATFKSDEEGPYYEGRCIRGHLKDCALQVASFFPETKNFRAKFVNRVYVQTDKIPLFNRYGKERIKTFSGPELRFIQVMTAQGPRSSLKQVDYIDSPRIQFTLAVLADGVIGEEHLRRVFEYGSVHGMGQERSQGWGRYQLASLQKVAKA